MVIIGLSYALNMTIKMSRGDENNWLELRQLYDYWLDVKCVLAVFSELGLVLSGTSR